MYMKNMLRDWTFAHLLDCARYLDYSKENTPTSKFEIWEKHELEFQGLGALEKETPNKKRLEGGKRRGNRQVQESRLDMQDKEDVPTQSQREVELSLVVPSLQKIPVTSTRTIPNQSKLCIYKCQGVSFSLTRMLEKTTGVNYPWCMNIKYWEENSIVYSFAHSHLCALSFNRKIDECLLGLNSCISDPNLDMAT
jgi:hypothetical protein